MSDHIQNNQFVNNLITQDKAENPKQTEHQAALFQQLDKQLKQKKIIGGTLYIFVFIAAFVMSRQTDRTDNAVHATLWMAASLHTLLWFLIYFLRCIYRGLAAMPQKNLNKEEKNWKQTDRFITTVACLVFVGTTIMLINAFKITDPLKAAGCANSVLWASVFCLFWYPFGIASLIGKLWLEFKKSQTN